MNQEEQHNTQPAPKPPTTASKGKKKRKQSKLPRWARITLRILRLLLVPILCVVALISGLILGYVYIGDQEMSEVWKIDTWKHVFDLMFG